MEVGGGRGGLALSALNYAPPLLVVDVNSLDMCL